MPDLSLSVAASLYAAARDTQPVAGFTHNYYRYPARFSPRFVSTAIAEFTEPGELVVDPFVGGGTTAVVAALANRRSVGSDVNSLATFVTRVKTTPLTREEMTAIRRWLPRAVVAAGYRQPRVDLVAALPGLDVRNLSSPGTRAIKKAMASLLSSAQSLPTQPTRDFVRCLLLRSGQWALDGRRIVPGVEQFRENVVASCEEMLTGMSDFAEALNPNFDRPIVVTCAASELATAHPFNNGVKTRLIVTSPPYVGVHVLYHRWQVAGRRETSAPYWLAGCPDGRHASFYTSGSRTPTGERRYFENMRSTFGGLREIIETGGYVVQLVAFSDPIRQSQLYLEAMESAGFVECSAATARAWRDVPHRKWHAAQKGMTAASRELVLIHRAC